MQTNTQLKQKQTIVLLFLIMLFKQNAAGDVPVQSKYVVKLDILMFCHLTHG